MARYLYLDGKDKTRRGIVSCVALAHNESNILPAFLRHYRRLGSFNFLIVDDNSTDSTTDYLRTQSDVTLFRPIDGSTYSVTRGTGVTNCSTPMRHMSGVLYRT